MNARFRSGIATTTAAAALLFCVAGADAADFTFTGDIVNHNDIIQFDFTLAGAGTGVRIWTDSWQSGLNFDPTGAVWRSTGSDYALVAAVDDDDTIGPGQGFYDLGFLFDTLAAGDYLFTLATAINAPIGSLLSQGFAYDSQTPIPIGTWNQPTYDPNANDQKGSFYRVNFANVDSAAPVPEPATWLMMALGLAGLAAWRRRCTH